MATQSPVLKGGGADDKPLREGPELSQPIDEISMSQAADGSQQNLPFITPEPIREEEVQNAVKFLSHPKVRGSPVIYRRSFLERKGLTKDEIDEAFNRVPDPPPNATASDSGATNLATQPRTTLNLQPEAAIQPLPVQAGVVPLSTTFHQRRFNWSYALFAIGVLSASGAGTAVLFKKVVLPRLKAWIRKVTAEDDASEKEDKSSKSLAEETAEAAKAAASAAAIVATASQELLNSKNEDRKYFEAFMGMIEVQVKEIKTMNEAIRKLEKTREQDRLIEEYFQSALANGTTNNSWNSSQVHQTDTTPNHVKVNGTPNAEYGKAPQSLASTSAEPMTAPHPKSYMEIMAMVQKGEIPSNIREIDDSPPNPNQSPSKPLIAPKKPWEFSQQSHVENGQSQDVSSDPWSRNKSVKITELESEDEEPLRKIPYSTGASVKPSSQRVWVPPQPPSVALPESAAAIRHLKPSPPIQEQHSNAEKTPNDGIAAGSSNSGQDIESHGSSSVAPHNNEIAEEEEGAYVSC
ncbi:peroxisomal membrane protein PEX14-like isoform X2 [Phalaenopsis equestris]|uniref:peroxisomal membrane protein PEX14-like isoform X2 n=1 Tax=Phalaenopsis equestris TaxID=78828 RepID=UPI0009E5727C|nr:peroxisomal membrane protein PEX14-like isoform X2 [Phalaenopsis equestris]